MNEKLLDNNQFGSNSYTFISENLTNVNDISYYYKFLILIGIFYILPSLEFVFFQSQDENVICYYNNLCKHDLGMIPAFNAILSNIFYIVYGLVFCIIVKKTFKYKHNGVTLDGLDNSPALYYSLGITLIFEGLCSATYHICPTKLNFQFDTTFMFIGAILMFITIYQKRNAAPYPMKIYSFIAFTVFMNILPLSGLSNGFDAVFWGFIFLIMAYIMVFGSIYLYYGKEYEFEYSSLKSLYRNVKNLKMKEIPKFALLVCINSYTLGMYIYAAITKPNFTDWFLGVTIINMLIYFVYYLILKIKHKEKIQKIFYIWIVLDIITISLSLVYFLKTSSNIFLPIEESNSLNKPCVVFNYFDYHDIWHILSATGLFIFINIVYFMDKHLNDELDSDIAVF
jgi:hypothetical protein